LYHHFRHKRALYEAVLARGIEPILALVAESAEESGTEGYGEAFVDRLVVYLADHPHLPRLIQRAALEDRRYLPSAVPRLLRRLVAARRPAPSRHRPLPAHLRLLRERGPVRGGDAAGSVRPGRRAAPAPVPEGRPGEAVHHQRPARRLALSAPDSRRRPCRRTQPASATPTATCSNR